ncbi:MAG: MgtC/SapB family protein [Desulfobulbaceae bacterium]|jgi:putative Mg2+ transporter-C (MgtC) family protein|nr:MgtC/SapB family protein [Desulfobulbaceae bacterium]
MIILQFSDFPWGQLLTAVLCGGLIGLERQLRGKPAGIRTSILICMGTQIFVYLGSTLITGVADPGRVIGQVVSGVGFLGGGVIMSKDGLVIGVTSAAVIWVLAAIGATIGLGQLTYAVIITITTLTVLIGVEFLENSVKRLQRGAHALYHEHNNREHRN